MRAYTHTHTCIYAHTYRRRLDFYMHTHTWTYAHTNISVYIVTYMSSRKAPLALSKTQLSRNADRSGRPAVDGRPPGNARIRACICNPLRLLHTQRCPQHCISIPHPCTHINPAPTLFLRLFFLRFLVSSIFLRLRRLRLLPAFLVSSVFLRPTRISLPHPCTSTPHRPHAYQSRSRQSHQPCF